MSTHCTATWPGHSGSAWETTASCSRWKRMRCGSSAFVTAPKLIGRNHGTRPRPPSHGLSEAALRVAHLRASDRLLVSDKPALCPRRGPPRPPNPESQPSPPGATPRQTSHLISAPFREPRGKGGTGVTPPFPSLEQSRASPRPQGRALRVRAARSLDRSGPPRRKSS
jgi:hypothetical protein